MEWESETMKGTVNVNEDTCYGSFEIYDKATGGDRRYAEGGLWFDEDMNLTDFDGAYDLPAAKSWQGTGKHGYHHRP